jgi:hypothetical protein
MLLPPSGLLLLFLPLIHRLLVVLLRLIYYNFHNFLNNKKKNLCYYLRNGRLPIFPVHLYMPAWTLCSHRMGFRDSVCCKVSRKHVGVIWFHLMSDKYNITKIAHETQMLLREHFALSPILLTRPHCGCHGNEAMAIPLINVTAASDLNRRWRHSLAIYTTINMSRTLSQIAFTHI